jgi:inward rectifier potassium channel
MEENSNRLYEDLELGFGHKNYRKSLRFINPDGRVNVERSGMGQINHLDFYHWLISISAGRLALIIITAYLLVNLLFATAYYMIGAENFGGVDVGNSEFQKFLNLFYFSSQTITTLGFGHIHPRSNAASITAAIESLLGLMAFAIATGILFGRFSRPRAHILYSRKALIAPYKDVKGLMFRIANKKQYELIECEASITLTLNNAVTGKREFFNLPLELSRINFLALSWTIVHPISEASPLYGLSTAELDERDAELLILVKAINDTFSQTVYSRYSYKAADIVGPAKFTPLKQEVHRNGKLRISVMDIHNFETVS